ncbi:unnamed protein product [Ilex paraguariensis]|uniref:AP2/ERF domain-containing protein n=1 Tax=Ilex paraguariensis TaxID=185542 RepID=A0ABC8T099_9AQUA
MEMVMVKNEENPGRRRMCMVDGKAPEGQCVKRRRRDTAASTLSCDNQQGQQQPPPQEVDQFSAPTSVKRSSRFRGVSRHRWTRRFEAHLWDKLSWNVTQKKKGKQGRQLSLLFIYFKIFQPMLVPNKDIFIFFLCELWHGHLGLDSLSGEINTALVSPHSSGAYDDEESAARAYDLAALKYWGTSTFTNFPISDYEKEIEIMQTITKEEYLASLRRKSSGFSRGVSKYRGVARHHHNGRWEARIGRVFGNKYLYLGTYSTQEDAARAYDVAAIEYRGINAVTNFDLSTYIKWLKPEKTSPVSVQEPQTNIESKALPSPNFNSGEEFQPFFHTNTLNVDEHISPLKQELFQGKFTASSCNKSSAPTALGLLLRSSMFRELVQKNLSISQEENDPEDTKNQAQLGSDDEYAKIFYEGTGDIPYVLSSNTHGIELQGDFHFSYNRQSNSLGTTL